MTAIFLDQNGSLVNHAANHLEPRRITLYDGAGAALRLLAQLDYNFFVVSNPDGVAHGRFAESALISVGDRLSDLLFHEGVLLDGFYYCPHHPGGRITLYAQDCTCRKPKPGLLLRAASEHCIDLSASWMIGDVLTDIEAGNRAGCRSLLIDNGNETAWRLGPFRVPTRIASSLYEAAIDIAAFDGVTA